MDAKAVVRGFRCIILFPRDTSDLSLGESLGSGAVVLRADSSGPRSVSVRFALSLRLTTLYRITESATATRIPRNGFKELLYCRRGCPSTFINGTTAGLVLMT